MCVCVCVCVLHELKPNVKVKVTFPQHSCVFFNHGIYDPVGAIKAPLHPQPPLNFCLQAFKFGATLLCVADWRLFLKYNLKKLIGGQDLAIRRVSKFKVDMIFIFIVNSTCCKLLIHSFTIRPKQVNK